MCQNDLLRGDSELPGEIGLYKHVISFIPEKNQISISTKCELLYVRRVDL